MLKLKNTTAVLPTAKMCDKQEKHVKYLGSCTPFLKQTYTPIYTL